MQLHYHQNYQNIDCPAYHHNKQLNTMKTLTHKSFLKMLAKPFGTLFLVFLLAFNANAQTTFTNGGGNNLWSNNLNWDSGTPSAADNATIPDGFLCILDIAGATCNNLFVGDGLGAGLAFLQVNANGRTLAARSVDVIATCKIQVAVGIDFKLRVTDGLISLNDGSCFVPGASTLTLGSGAVTPAGGTIALVVPGTVNLFNLEIDYGVGKTFLHGTGLGLSIANNLLLTSGILGNGGAATSTLVVGGDLIVPIPGGTIARLQKTGDPVFDAAAGACTTPTTTPPSGNPGSTLQVRDVKIASGATLTFLNSTYLKVSRHWGDISAPNVSTGGISTAGTTPTIEFNGATNGQIFGLPNGNHVNFSTAFVVINKTAGSQFTTSRGMISTRSFAIKSGDFSVSTTDPQFNNVCISGGDFQHTGSVPQISGNWTLVEKGTFFKGDPITFPANATTISFVGTTKSIIKIIPDGSTLANTAVNQPFRTLVINKTTAFGIVENSSGAGNGTVIRALQQLSIQGGLLFINEVTTSVPVINQVAGFTVTHADGTKTDVPSADLQVKNKLIIDAGAGLNFTNVLSAGVPAATNTPSTLLTLWVGAEFKDNNSSEPTATTGFYIGNPSVLGRFSDRPVVVFTEDSDIDVGGNYLLRNALDQNVGTPLGIVLPNVIIARQGATTASTVRTVSIGKIGVTGGMRVLGDNAGLILIAVLKSSIAPSSSPRFNLASPRLFSASAKVESISRAKVKSLIAP